MAVRRAKIFLPLLRQNKELSLLGIPCIDEAWQKEEIFTLKIQ
jgi:hypothetical protein